TGEQVKLYAAGRTDAGAHAEGQVANFHYGGRLTTARLTAALNARLPPDVAVLRADEAAPDFHARYSARRRRYRYPLPHRPHPPGARPRPLLAGPRPGRGGRGGRARRGAGRPPRLAPVLRRVRAGRRPRAHDPRGARRPPRPVRGAGAAGRGLPARPG